MQLLLGARAAGYAGAFLTSAGLVENVESSYYRLLYCSRSAAHTKKCINEALAYTQGSAISEEAPYFRLGVK